MLATRTALAAIATLCITGFAPTQDKVTLKMDPAQGDAFTHDYTLKMNILGMDATLSSRLKTKVTKREGETIETESAWENFKVDLGGSNPEIPTSPLLITVSTSGKISKIAGGIEGSDGPRTYLLLHYIAPNKELAVGDSYTVELDADPAVPIPAVTYTGKYEGKAEVKGQAGHKLTVTIKEKAEAGLSSESTFIVTEGGRILSAESKFKNLLVPQLGQSVDGSMKAEIVP
jgi:hypothetical protein